MLQGPAILGAGQVDLFELHVDPADLGQLQRITLGIQPEVCSAARQDAEGKQHCYCGRPHSCTYIIGHCRPLHDAPMKGPAATQCLTSGEVSACSVCVCAAQALIAARTFLGLAALQSFNALAQAAAEMFLHYSSAHGSQSKHPSWHHAKPLAIKAAPGCDCAHTAHALLALVHLALSAKA